LLARFGTTAALCLFLLVNLAHPGNGVNLF